jgi:hypothetical protein
MDPDAREDRLPQWVRDKFSVLRRNVNELKRGLDEFGAVRAGKIEAALVITDGLNYRHPYPGRLEVEFMLRTGRISARVGEQNGFAGLKVNGDHGLLIHPWASNDILIEMKP